MEFKKPNRPTRPTSDISQHRNSVSVAPRPALQLRPVTLDTSRVNATDAPVKKKSRRSRLAHLLRNKKILLSIAALVIIGLIASLFTHDSSSSDTPTPSPMKPTYQTTLPKGKTIDDLGGWKRVSPAKDIPVFAFVDEIDDIPVSVSEQPLPQSFKSNTNSQVADLAKKFNTTDKIDATGTPAYIGTSSKGPQSVIFTNNNLLILMKSARQISNASWAKYVESLK